jgi:hypothetical protein
MVAKKLILAALLASLWACGGNAAQETPDAGTRVECGDGVCSPGESCPADCDTGCTQACSADGSAANYCDENDEQVSVSCPSGLGSSCEESFAWCDCGTVTFDGACYDDASLDVDLVVCEDDALVFYGCIPGTYCDVDAEGFADCACDNADDGICPDADCTEDPDCQSCTPDCGDRECGDNGCGGSCGSCSVGSSCGADGQCKTGDGGGTDSPWTAETTPTTAGLYGLAATLANTSEPAVYAVGDGVILKRRASSTFGSWVDADASWDNAGIDDKLWLSVATDRFGIGSYAVSLDGYVARRDEPLGWRVIVSGSLGFFNDVALVDYNNGILVGDEGLVVLLVESSLSEFDSGVTTDLSAAWIDEDNVFVVGDEGTILAREGGGFQSVTSPASGDLVDIAGSSPTELWAVTRDGEVIRRGAGGTFGLLEQQPDVVSASALWATGDQVWISDIGSIHHWDGQSWSEEALPTDALLSDIFGREAGSGGVELWAAGDEGTILYRRPQ